MTDTRSSALIDGATKPRPVQLIECARCHKDISEEAVPIAVRVAAFVVPKATRDRQLERTPFDITDVGIPEILRELVDQDKHPDGHVFLGLGCFMALFGPEFSPVTDAGVPVAIVPMRAELNVRGISNTSFTGREHRSAPVPAPEVELYDRDGVRINPDGSPWVGADGTAPAPRLP